MQKLILWVGFFCFEEGIGRVVVNWKSMIRKGEDMSVFLGVMQTNVMVTDIVAAKNWYSEILQCKIEKDYGTTVVLSFGGGSPLGTLCLIQDKEAAGRNHSTSCIANFSEIQRYSL